MIQTKLMQRFNFSKVFALCLLLTMLTIGAIPGYLSSHWSWMKPPLVNNLKQIKSLRENGLKIPDWQTVNQKPIAIGGHKWLFQSLRSQDQTEAVLLLIPQNSHTSQPEVEWMDIKGFQRWQTDSDRQLQFTALATKPANLPSANVKANFFRAWNQQQTYAVVQWYAWPEGGNPSPIQWFLADQKAQWQKRRVPWIAVSVQIPIEPLGDIEKIRPLAESLAQNVQSSLMGEF